MTEDETIIRRVLDGDIQAYRGVVERYQGPVYRLVRNLLAQPADAEDIVQDVLLAAFSNLAKYDPRRSAFSTWLFVIARNKCLNAAKRRWLLNGGDFPEPVDSRTPDDALSRREWFQQFDTALAALPFDQRTAFVLAEIEGLSYEDIARVEGVKLGTVKSRIRRAKDKLRQLIEPAESKT
jgi:RNA polymerase sigma-70 factor (ECF subfamily)